MAFSDKCIFVEAFANDNGTHVDPANLANPEIWLSPDLTIPGNVANPTDTAVKVTVHMHPTGQNGCQGLNSETQSIQINVFVGLPGMILFPNDTEHVTRITNAAGRAPLSVSSASDMDKLAKTGTVDAPFTWTRGTTVPESPGHKCLVAQAIVKPDDEEQPASAFDLHEPHTMQHNICIIDCNAGLMGGSGLREGAAQGGCSQIVGTVNPNPKEVQGAIIRAVADLAPNAHVLNTALPLLQRTPGFKRIVNVPPRGFGLQLPDFPNAKITDNTLPGPLVRLLGLLLSLFRSQTRLFATRGLGEMRSAQAFDSPPGCLGQLLALFGLRPWQPLYEAQIEMQPGQSTDVIFQPDLSGSQPGDAHVFHLMHLGTDQRLLGGLTILAIRQ